MQAERVISWHVKVWLNVHVTRHFSFAEVWKKSIVTNEPERQKSGRQTCWQLITHTWLYSDLLQTFEGRNFGSLGVLSRVDLMFGPRYPTAGGIERELSKRLMFTRLCEMKLVLLMPYLRVSPWQAVMAADMAKPGELPVHDSCCQQGLCIFWFHLFSSPSFESVDPFPRERRHPRDSIPSHGRQTWYEHEQTSICVSCACGVVTVRLVLRAFL